MAVFSSLADISSRPNQAFPSRCALPKRFIGRVSSNLVNKCLPTLHPRRSATFAPVPTLVFLRGEKKINNAYAQLQSIDWEALKSAQPVL